MTEHETIRFRSRAVAGSGEMDMTPMVDVTFLLLIFFMITAAFAIQRSFEVPTPQNSEASSNATLEDLEQDPEFLVVRVDRFNTFHVATAASDREIEAPNRVDLLFQMRKAIAEAGARRPRRLLILAHGDAYHDHVVQAIDAGNAIGLEDVKIVTLEGDELD